MPPEQADDYHAPFRATYAMSTASLSAHRQIVISLKAGTTPAYYQQFPSILRLAPSLSRRLPPTPLLCHHQSFSNSATPVSTVDVVLFLPMPAPMALTQVRYADTMLSAFRPYTVHFVMYASTKFSRGNTIGHQKFIGLTNDIAILHYRLLFQFIAEALAARQRATYRPC